MISAYRTQAKTVYAAIEAFVASEIADGNDYVIEGYHIEPELITKLVNDYPDQIRGVMIIKKDVNKLINGFTKSSTPNDWIINRTTDTAMTLPKIAKMISEYSKILERESAKYNVKTFATDVDYDLRIKNASEYLKGKV
jgi:2-phosphoglycerate kinase